MSGPTTFRGWLHAHVNDDSVLGNLARSVAADRCAVWNDEGTARPMEGYDSLRRHIRSGHTKREDVMTALHAAYEARRAERRYS